MSAILWPGPGRYPLDLDTPGFFLLLLLLAMFGTMLYLLYRQYPRRKRGLEGYYEAASIDLGFLVGGCLLVLVLAAADPHGNRTSLALFEVVLGGYWFTFAIPIVTVGTSIHKRTRGGIPWMVPSVAASIALFFGLFAFYFVAA